MGNNELVYRIGRGAACHTVNGGAWYCQALIATAMGLFAAIPAVIGYNRFADIVERLIGRYENFAEEFATILQRQSQKKAASRADSVTTSETEKS